MTVAFAQSTSVLGGRWSRVGDRICGARRRCAPRIQGTRSLRNRRLTMATELVAPTAKLKLGKPRSLYPPINPYKVGYLDVSDLHTVYYEVSGNPNGIPVCFLHGGPGGGTVDAHRRFFDPTVYKIILFDQRGCGKSRPPANLEDNTTWTLIDDMEKIREELRIERWVLFGGSWGSTLSVAYAQCHADRVLALILRGIFMIRKQELAWLYERSGAAMLYPEAFECYVCGLPEHLRDAESLMNAYHSVLSSETASAERKKAANAWTKWEQTLSTFPRRGEADAPANAKYTDEENLAFARIECHYFVNGGFVEQDGFLLAEEQMKKIRHIKTTIVQGRWDMVCPRTTAHDLVGMFEGNVEFVIVDNAGHSTFESGIEQELLKATDSIGKEFKTLCNGGATTR